MLLAQWKIGVSFDLHPIKTPPSIFHRAHQIQTGIEGIAGIGRLWWHYRRTQVDAVYTCNSPAPVAGDRTAAAVTGGGGGAVVGLTTMLPRWWWWSWIDPVEAGRVEGLFRGGVSVGSDPPMSVRAVPRSWSNWLVSSATFISASASSFSLANTSDFIVSDSSSETITQH